MNLDYIKTWKEVIQRPNDFYRKMPTTGGYTEPLTFAAISYFIYGLLGVLFDRETVENCMHSSNIELSLSTMLLFLIVIPVIGITSIFIGAIFFDIIYKLLGGTGNYRGTVRFISYASSVMVFSWIPLVGWIFRVYEMYLYIVGGKFVHNISMGKSTVAVFMPLLLMLFLILLLSIAGTEAF